MEYYRASTRLKPPSRTSFSRTAALKLKPPTLPKHQRCMCTDTRKLTRKLTRAQHGINCWHLKSRPGITSQGRGAGANKETRNLNAVAKGCPSHLQSQAAQTILAPAHDARRRAEEDCEADMCFTISRRFFALRHGNSHKTYTQKVQYY